MNEQTEKSMVRCPNCGAELPLCDTICADRAGGTSQRCGNPPAELFHGNESSVYLYIDEAGNFDFSPKGSKYLILTCAVLRRPFSHIYGLSSIKYDCLEKGLDPKRNRSYHEFHAAEDRQSVRDRVFGAIGAITGLAIYSVVIRKNMTNPTLRPPEKIYSKAFDWLLDDVKRGEGIDSGDSVIVVTDAISLKGKNDALKSSLLYYMDKEFNDIGISSKLYQHQSCSDFNLQVVDYCSWAIQRRWEKDDGRSMDTIAPMVKHVGDIFRNGDTVYYRFGKEK